MLEYNNKGLNLVIDLIYFAKRIIRYANIRERI